MDSRPVRSATHPWCRLPVGALLLLALVGMSSAAVIDGRIAYLTATTGKLAGGNSAGGFAGSLRFVAAPGSDQLRELRGLGIEFSPHHSRTVYPARIPFVVLDSLSRRDDLIHIACAWRPAHLPPLAYSAVEVEADQVWALDSPAGGTVTGKGVTICDLDSGVDVRHASFFGLSGERFAWLDLDASGNLSAGDAVDLDGDGARDFGELLAHREAIGTARYGNLLGVYDSDLDFLYNDHDKDGELDQGPPEYSDEDPCFGERLFLSDDTNGNRRLDPGEELLALGGSRIRAIRDRDGTVHRRGVDLLASDGDYFGHGTPVTGIAVGGWPGRHRMTGIAPGAEMLHVVIEYTDEAPFLVPVEEGLAWAVAEGADIVLVEDGEWIWEYMDGSSNFETMMNEYAAEDGIIFVVPVGNLASGNMHAQFASTEQQALDLDAEASVAWLSFLWTAPTALELRIAPPGQPAIAIPLDGATVAIGGYRIFAALSVSPRGTRRLDLRLSSADAPALIGGHWSFAFAGQTTDLHGYFTDDVSFWESPSRWAVGTTAASTVTWPATADSNIGVAAYNAHPGYEEILPFSGRGPRLDGFPLVDVAAPGANVSTADPTNANGFVNFSGTSCAGPHVAGAIALLKELAPDLDHAACRRYLREGAVPVRDTVDPAATGAGKLRIHRSVLRLLEDLSGETPTALPSVGAFPNPFNRGSTIRFRQWASGTAQVRLFDVAGREVWSRAVAWGDSGLRTVFWDGTDADGRALPSGVYFAHVGQAGTAAACKLTLLR
jgi:subtilisin family serine protease